MSAAVWAWLLVVARVVQGLGAGTVPAVAYACIGRSYPPSARPRMFAVLSTAWVVPALVGPALAGVVARGLGWRWVFLGLLPLVAIAAVMTLPALFRIGASSLLNDLLMQRSKQLTGLYAGPDYFTLD